VARRGKRLRHTYLEARLLPVESPESRIGLVVPKHGQSAVRRNRLKRQLRERIRLQLLPGLEMPGARSMDIVFRAQPAAYQASVIALVEELDTIIAAIIRSATKGG
jgi:ribonuclease P protein component